MIKKQNAFIKENSIVSVYDAKERDIGKFTKLIDNKNTYKAWKQQINPHQKENIL